MTGSGPGTRSHVGLAESLAPFVALAAEAIARPYPSVYPLVLAADGPVTLPRLRTPVFCGSFDWHSAVHGHWALVRALRSAPEASWAGEARAALARSLTEPGLATEHAHLIERPTFERPYGLAWLLRLAADLHDWDDADGRRWRAGLAPLESLAAQRLLEWAERLPRPIRSGEHSQSAFALALVFDWALATGDRAARARVESCARAMHENDRDAPVRFEPSAHDFLSAILGAADLMRRVLEPAAFAAWFTRYLPEPGSDEVADWLSPLTPPDRRDGKLAHLDGLNLTRAWMLEGVLAALPSDHRAVGPLSGAAAASRAAGLRGALDNQDWMGTHWLGSFAVYLLTHAAATGTERP